MTSGAFILAPEGPRLTPDERAFFHDAQPWGFILFARHAEDPDQLSALTADLRDAVGRDTPIFIDQEGGRVARLRSPHWTEWPTPLDEVERLGDLSVQALSLRYSVISAELRAIGIDGNCSPLADIAQPDTHAVLRNRCYGSDLDKVVANARAVAEAHLAAGVLPVLKHMPGHGRAVVDSHLELPRVDADRETLIQNDFAAFARLADLPLAMTAHIVFSAFDDKPATASSTMIDMIRNQIGFGGLLMTDDISMNALQGSVGERGQRALDAGCDIVLHCNGDLREMQEIANLGPMSSDAEERGLRALALRKPQMPVDIEALLETYKILQRNTA